MTMNRRGFLGSILALCAAPAIVRADSLMRIVPREARIIHGPTEILTAGGWIAIDSRYADLAFYLGQKWGASEIRWIGLNKAASDLKLNAINKIVRE